MNRPKPIPIALYAGVALATVLVGFYYKVILPFVGLPADLLMWGETDFVGNIIRFRGGHPMYSPVDDINSSTYPPLAALVTYGVVWLLRLPVEVPVLRAVQLAYVALGALLGYACWRVLRSLVLERSDVEQPRAWAALVVMTVLLAATSPATSEWIHALHTDALTMLWSIASFLALLLYVRAPSRTGLVLLCLLPAAGFAVKQYLLIWAPINFVALLIDDPRNRRRLVGLFVVTTGLTLAGIGLCFLLWGRDYLFWVFEVVGGARSRIGFSAGGFEMSVPRAADHVLRAWAPLSLGFIGGWLLIRRRPTRRLAALWVPWLLLIAAEAMTSGTGWGSLYHFGPGVAIGSIWLLAVLPEVWPERNDNDALHPLARSAWAFAALLLTYLALAAVPSGEEGQQRYWARGLPEGSDEFIVAIESELVGLPPERVLLDWGNWPYLESGFLARDRAVAMADFPTVGRYDLLEPLLERIRTRQYVKIIVQRLHSPGFLYDWGNLERSTGIRAALLENYREVRVIPGFESDGAPQVQFNGPVSVLVPRE
jgi:hypothetical protein